MKIKINNLWMPAVCMALLLPSLSLAQESVGTPALQTLVNEIDALMLAAKKTGRQ